DHCCRGQARDHPQPEPGARDGLHPPPPPAQADGSVELNHYPTEAPMAFRINHIHLKAPDPRRTAEWYVKAFDFKIVNDETRVFGDRFIRCQSVDGGMAVNISGPRTGEKLGPGDASAHFGLEHFGFDTTEIEGDIRRPEGLGPNLLERPHQLPTDHLIASPPP